MTLTRERLNEILSLHDERGVLSIYLTADPREEASARPAWRVRIERGLVALRDGVRDDRRRSIALADRIAQLGIEFEQLLDASAAGRGRALFAPLSSPAVYTIALQAELPELVHLAPVPHVVPLLRAWTLGAPAGAAVVSDDGIRLIDLRFGLTQDTAVLTHRDERADRRELVGPAAANPARSQHSAPQHDLYARRAAQRTISFLRGAGQQVAAAASEAGWEDLIVLGEPELTTATIEGLPPDTAVPALTMANRVTSVPTNQIAGIVGDELAAARRQRAGGLAGRARDAALAGARGAYGLPDVLTALTEGRVAHLLMDSDGRWRGRRAPDGRLVPDDELLPDVPSVDLVEEPDLGDRMIVSAHGAGAEVTVLDGLEVLAPAGGVAALLRW